MQRDLVERDLGQLDGGLGQSPTMDTESTLASTLPTVDSPNYADSESWGPVDSTTTSYWSDWSNHNAGPGWWPGSEPATGSPRDLPWHEITSTRNSLGSLEASSLTVRLLSAGPSPRTGIEYAKLLRAASLRTSLQTFTFVATTKYRELLLTMRSLWDSLDAHLSIGGQLALEKAKWLGNGEVPWVYNLSIRIPVRNGGAAIAIMNMLLWMK